MNAASNVHIGIRRYESRDEPGVLNLLGATLGGGPAGTRTPEFLRWKHLENPFGESFMLVADADDLIVGFRAFMRWRFTTGDREITAVRAVDTATHPDHQRRGIFSRLTLAAIDALRSDVDLIFNTPNEKSLGGYLKMGWPSVATVPIQVRVRRPIRFARHARSFRSRSSQPMRLPPVLAETATEALRSAEGLSLLLRRAETFPGRIATARTIEYLRWRYGSAPQLDYRAVVQQQGGKAIGLAIFRIRPRGRLWESTVSELIVGPGERTTARRLLRDVAEAADVDHITLSFPAASTAAGALGPLAFRVPGGMTFATNPLAENLDPDPTRLASWALSLGDLEVF